MWRTPATKRWRPFTTSGRFMREMGTMGPETLMDPRQVAVDREGNLFVLDAARGRVLAYDPQGVLLGGFGTMGKAPGFLNRPRDFALMKMATFLWRKKAACRHSVWSSCRRCGERDGLQRRRLCDAEMDAVKTRIPGKYVVYRAAPQGESQKLKEIVDTTFTDDTLTPETTYTYTVAAESVQGALSVPSAKVQAMAKAITKRAARRCGVRPNRRHLFGAIQILQPRACRARRDPQQRLRPRSKNEGAFLRFKATWTTRPKRSSPNSIRWSKGGVVLGDLQTTGSWK